MTLVNDFLNKVKETLVLKIKNLISSMLVSLFNLVKMLDLVNFIFLNLDKLRCKLLPITSFLLALIAIRADLVVFHIEISDIAILLKP